MILMDTMKVKEAQEEDKKLHTSNQAILKEEGQK
jgi:hypothetical protein